MKANLHLLKLLSKQSALNKAQKRLHKEVCREWHDHFYHNGKSLYDYRKEAEEMVGWLYHKAGLPCPKVVLATSPLHAQQIANRIHQRERSLAGQQYFPVSRFGGIRDMSWIALYDFFIRLGMLKDEDFIRYRDFLKAVPIYEMIQGNQYCILTDMPSQISLDYRLRLHAERKPALAWPDGFCLYYWHGLRTRMTYIMEPEKIDRQVFMSERNAEQRRLILEILRDEKLREVLDLLEIDRYQYQSHVPILDEEQLSSLSQEEINQLAVHAPYELRQQGYILYRSRYPDDIADDFLYFVKVTDPSTGRQYYLPVSPEDATSAKDAVDASFGEQDLVYTAEA
jgi:hypothetical protein